VARTIKVDDRAIAVLPSVLTAHWSHPDSLLAGIGKICQAWVPCGAIWVDPRLQRSTISIGVIPRTLPR